MRPLPLHGLNGVDDQVDQRLCQPEGVRRQRRHGFFHLIHQDDGALGGLRAEQLADVIDQFGHLVPAADRATMARPG